MNVTGFVTAGGQSSRMGTDKAWLELGGQTMISRVIAALFPVTSSVAIIANDPVYERLGLPVFADTNLGIGPLEAIRTALANTTTPRVVMAACDLPFVTSEFFSCLLEFDGSHQAVVPLNREGLVEPLCGVYSRKALAQVTELIASGERKVSRLFDKVPARLVSFSEVSHLKDAELFFENINTPEEYERASDLLRQRTGS
ncbi:MAG TPA: molybdenum cofactor guanylyltransferase [Blastocatellia bacterium]|nr:molybdenum cofactor guanylyltransferase [Blastocatellia bacterium]